MRNRIILVTVLLGFVNCSYTITHQLDRFHLRTIAEGSADKAHIAVSNQNFAAMEAAFLAQSTFAQAANQAAATATVALVSKKLLLQILDERKLAAEKSLENELLHYELAKAVAMGVENTARETARQRDFLTAVLNQAQIAARSAQNTADLAQTDVAAQVAMVNETKKRLNLLLLELKEAREEFKETKEAADSAAISAFNAQTIASEEASVATVQLQDLAIAEVDNFKMDDVDEINAVMKLYNKLF